MPEDMMPPLTPHSPVPQFAKRFARTKLAMALVGAVSVALLLVVLSTWLYVASGAITTDLSRPGYEHEREEVRTGGTGEKIYDTTSPVNLQAISEFLSEYDQRVKEIQGYGNFTSPALNDIETEITPNGG